MIVFAPDIMKRLSDKGWSAYRLRMEKAIPEGTMSRIRQSKPVTTTTLDVLCKLLECQPGDLIRWVPDKEEGQV